jgi:hypothetical protein
MLMSPKQPSSYLAHDEKGLWNILDTLGPGGQHKSVEGVCGEHVLGFEIQQLILFWQGEIP